MVSSCLSFQQDTEVVPARPGLPTKAKTSSQQEVEKLLLFPVSFIATTASLVTIHFNNHTSTPLFPTGTFTVITITPGLNASTDLANI